MNTVTSNGRVFLFCRGFVLSSAFTLWAGLATPLAAEYTGQPYAGGDVFADTWVATDGLGRVLPGFRECGRP